MDLASELHWKKIGMRPRHGIDIPLFSLRTYKSCGIGEFLDLILLIDWCHERGFEVIQLLPLNDSGNDPSPYNALSSCALHPIYLSLGNLPGRPKPLSGSSLNNLPRLSYLEVLTLKLNFLRQYFTNEGEKIASSTSFKQFVEKSPWLIPYALFKVLKDKLQHTPWTTWPQKLKIPDLNQLQQEHGAEIEFYLVLQYLCHLQLQEARAHAISKGILLKGDIPILISQDSVDVWSKPHLFNFALAAGAPPDAYNREGQYWGFPLFNWEDLKASDFLWWKERLKAAAQYFDLYRIDHVVGFFRIWAIPTRSLSAGG